MRNAPKGWKRPNFFEDRIYSPCPIRSLLHCRSSAAMQQNLPRYPVTATCFHWFAVRKGWRWISRPVERRRGCPPGSAGVVTSTGSSCNVTACGQRRSQSRMPRGCRCVRRGQYVGRGPWTSRTFQAPDVPAANGGPADPEDDRLHDRARRHHRVARAEGCARDRRGDAPPRPARRAPGRLPAQPRRGAGCGPARPTSSASCSTPRSRSAASSRT